MPCSAIFSMILQTEILSTVTSDFLKQMIILKSLVFCDIYEKRHFGDITCLVFV